MGNYTSRQELESVLNSIQHKCFCCGILEKTSNSACIYHKLCSDCAIKSYNNKFTLCCLNFINPNFIVEFKNKHICYKCENTIEPGKFQICKCQLCKSCTQVSFKNALIRKCTDCNSDLNRDSFIMCYVCNKLTGKDNMINHQCGEYICFTCVKQGSSTKHPDFDFISIECPKCTDLYDESHLIPIFGEEKTSKLFRMFLRKKFDMAECPNCLAVFILESSNENFYNCLNCRTYFCKQCQKDLNSCICYNDFTGSFKALSINQNSTISCPECSRPYIKNKSILFQECANINCKATFCSNCSSLRSQIDCHGLNFHNISCSHYKKSSQLAKFNPNCTKCKESNIPCKPSWEIEKLRKWST